MTESPESTEETAPAAETVPKTVPVAPPAPAAPAVGQVSELTAKKFAEWSTKLGVPVANLQKAHAQLIAKLKTLYPQKAGDIAWLDGRARHNMATKLNESLRVKAEAFTITWAYDAGKVDTNARFIEDAVAMYNNPETRDEAVAKGLTFSDGRAKDGRQWYVEPAAGRPGRKNPNYGKELKPFYQRRMIGFGRKFDEAKEIVKVVVATLRGAQADLVIPKFTPVNMRMNIRAADETKYGLTSSTKTEVEQVVDEVLAKIKPENVMKLLDTASLYSTETKKGMKTTVFNIVEFLAAHPNDSFAVTVLEADLSRVPDEPTVTGNWALGVGDAEEDVEARGITCFTPDEIYKQVIEPLGIGSRLLWIGTPRAATDIFTDEKTATLNVIAALVKTKVSKEESMFELGADLVFAGTPAA